MTDSARYAAPQEIAIRQSWLATNSARCPECDVAMRERRITGGSFGLGYQRRREWLMCPKCKRSVLFDADRGTRT